MRVFFFFSALFIPPINASQCSGMVCGVRSAERAFVFVNGARYGSRLRRAVYVLCILEMSL